MTTKLKTMEQANKEFERDNPQFFTTAKSNTNQSNIDAFNAMSKSLGSKNEYVAGKGVVPIISSEKGSSTITKNIQDQNNDLVRIQPEKTTTETTKTKTTKNLALENIGGITAEEASATNTDLNDYTFDGNSGYYIPTSKTEAGQLTAQYAEDEKQIRKSFDEQLKSFDASSRELVESIKGIYSSRIQAQQDLNKRSLQRYNTLGIRGGAGRYAPEIQNSILTGEEREGLKRIETIAYEEKEALMRAQQNLTDKKYQAFVDERNEIKALQKEKSEKLAKLNEIALKKKEEQDKQIIQSSRDDAITNLFQQDPNIDIPTMLDYLNYNEMGNKVGDFTADEVSKVMKIIKPNANLEGLNPDLRTLKYLQGIGDPSVKGMNLFQFQAAVSNAQRKPETPDGEKPIAISTEKKTVLLGVGFNQSDISNIEKDVQTYGLPQVLEGITDEKQKTALQKVYGSSDTTELTRENLAKLYGLTDDESQSSSILGIEYGDTNKEKIDAVMDLVERYKGVGYSDKEILKLIQE